MTHLVLIADIVGSRQLAERGQVQHRLETVLAERNARTAGLESAFTITLGDEFQAVLDTADRLFQDMLAVMIALHPVEVRFALGIGAIVTPINPERAIGMDGPAFHQAREALERLKRQDALVTLEGGCGRDELVTGSLALLGQHLRKWKPNRLRVLQLSMQGARVAAIAECLGISEQGVYKNIRMGGMDAVMQVMQALTHRINASLKP